MLKKFNIIVKYLYTLKIVKLFSYIITIKLQGNMYENLKIELEKCVKHLNKLEEKMELLKNKIQSLNNDIENRKYLTHEYKYGFYYGSQILIGAIVKGLLLVITGLILHILPQILIATGSFMILRVYIGGLHFDSYTKCAWTSLASLVTLGLLAKYIPYNSLINLIVFVTLFFIIHLFAPVENKNRPLKENEKTKFKYIAFILLFVLFIAQNLIINNNNINNCIMYGVLLAGIIALPVFKNVE